MNESVRILAYEKVNELLTLINDRDLHGLDLKFGISFAVFDEIEEILGKYFSDSVMLSPPPLSVAFSSEKGLRLPFDFYQMNDQAKWGVECVLWANSIRSEPILHVEIEVMNGGVKLYYKYIGS